MSDNHPNFYAIIPASVRYCKSLSANAKLLYGEITALCSKEGFCWAANKYFAELYEVDERTIPRWLNDLKDEGFIKIDLTKEGLKTIRKIWIVNELKLSLRNDKNAMVDPDKNATLEHGENATLLLQANINTKKAASCLKRNAAAPSSKNILSFDHPIWNNDKKTYKEVTELFVKRNASKPITKVEGWITECLKNKWHEVDIELSKRNEQDRSLNVKYAFEIEKRYKRLPKHPMCGLWASKSEFGIMIGGIAESLPSYDMSHELFKRSTKDILKKKNIWDKLF